jgi:hypothetical protein
MSNRALVKVAAKTAAEVCKQFPLSEEAKQLLGDALTPRLALDMLIDRGQWVNAVRFLAHALPKREAVWWACQCLRSVSAPDVPAAVTSAIQAAEKWAKDPKEENRRATQAAAEAAGLDTAAGCAAMAAFFSGGSMGPPHLKQPIPPGPTLTARMVAAAVMLAAVQLEPEKAPEKYQRFLTHGMDLAAGTALIK